MLLQPHAGTSQKWNSTVVGWLEASYFRRLVQFRAEHCYLVQSTEEGRCNFWSATVYMTGPGVDWS